MLFINKQLLEIIIHLNLAFLLCLERKNGMHGHKSVDRQNKKHKLIILKMLNNF